MKCHVVISEIIFMINNRSTRSLGVGVGDDNKRRFRSERELFLMPGNSVACISPPGRAKISEKEPGTAEWWPLSDYEKMCGMDENYQAK